MNDLINQRVLHLVRRVVRQRRDDRREHREVDEHLRINHSNSNLGALPRFEKYRNRDVVAHRDRTLDAGLARV